jgi:hypothetical protein
MLSEDELDGTFEVIGSTAIPQAPHLPFYLPQILRAADGSIYLENHDGFTRTFSYHGLDLDDLAPYLALVSPIPARPHHRLMQLDADQEPQYLGRRHSMHTTPCPPTTYDPDCCSTAWRRPLSSATNSSASWQSCLAPRSPMSDGIFASKSSNT